MALRRLFHLFCCLFAWNSRLPAQSLPAPGTGSALLFRNLDNTSGLISDEVFSVTQDKNGYIWIGTLKGLQRYDGFRFRNFIDSGYQLPNDGLIVTSLYADSSRDRLMYNQFNQEMKERTGLDHRAGTLLPEKEFRPSAGVAYTGAGGERWVCEPYFLSKTSANGRVSEGIELIKEPYLDKPYFAFFFRDNKTKKTWVTEPRHGLLLFDDSTHRVIEPNRQPDQNPLFNVIKGRNLGVRKIQMDHNGDIWLVDWSDKLLRMSPESATLQTYDLSKINRPKNISSGELPVWATSVLEDNHGVIWVGTAHAGLLRFQADSNRFTSTLHRPGDALSLQYNHEINNLFQDKEENIWVATDKGVSFFNPYQQDFIELDETDAHPDNLPRSEINGGLVDSNGNFLVVYWGGGIRLYNRKLELKKTLHFPTAETNLLWGAIRSDDGTTWVACQHGYLHLLDREYNLKQTLHPAELENSTIRCMAKDREGNLYFGLHNGKIVRWNAAKKSFSAYLGSNLPRGMTLSSVLYLFIDRQNRCWAGTNNGLALFDPEKRNYTAFFRPDINMPTPCHGIEQVNDSTLATGLENAGLYFLNVRTRRFFRPPGANSSFETSVYAVKKDSSGNIWFTTDYDICRYNPQLQVFSLSSPERGYLRAGFEGNYFIPAISGNWFSWTKTEMIGFDPATLIASEKAGLPVSITGFSVFDKPLFIDSLLKNRQPVELSYRNNFIAISFSNLVYSSAARTRYFYRLVGVDKDWVASGPQHQAAYTGLAPGKYRFEVTTESVFNTRSMTSFDLVLTPPFWQTNWFRVLSVLLIAGITFLIVSGYIRNIRRESDMKQQIVRTEMMALRAQMNPHFIFNCINSIDALIQSDDKYLATVYLNKFAKLIRNILDSSKETTITLKRDLETLQLYVDLERFRNRDNFSVDIRADELLLQQDFKVPPLIIQPYVENAIHHGLRNRIEGGGKLTIDISRQQDQLLYVIEDNGVGRNASGANNKKYRSYGMEMSLDRLKLFNQQSDIPVIITDLVENGKAAGTRVEVSLHIK